MKKIFAVVGLLFVYTTHAQKGDELLVYSLKGTVTVVENNKESKVKIGKVLKPGSTIKTQKLAKLTMVCRQGKPLSVTKEGSFPVTKWKDSCETSGHNSMTSKYFQYIWDQLYVRSEDYRKEHSDEVASVVRSDAPIRGEDDMEIYFNEAYDTVIYAAGSFPLSWTTNYDAYRGNYFFKLVDAKDKKAIYTDSLIDRTIGLDKLKRFMKPGGTYQWFVATKKAGTYTGGVIQYVPLKTVSQQIVRFQKLIDVPEDAAAQSFRVAYLLENSHYLADAFIYYEKAVKAAPGESFYSDKFYEFKKTFQLLLF